NVFRMPGDGFDVFQVAGVGEAIQIDQTFDLGRVDDMVNDIRANETRPARDQEIHTPPVRCWSAPASGCHVSSACRSATCTGRMATRVAKSLLVAKMKLDRGGLA